MAKLISRSTMTIGIIAVLAGLAAVWGVRSYLAQEEEVPAVAEKPAQPQVIRLPLAAQDLPADRVVAQGDLIHLTLTKRQILERFKGADLDQMLKLDRSIVNHRLKVPIKGGHPFLTTAFYLYGAGPSIAKKLQPGFRAIRIQVPNTREASVQPGMYVDVMFRANARPAKAGQPATPEKTLTLLRHIEVIEAERPPAVGSRRAVARKPLLYTLAVPEAKADMFGVIEGRGELWLVPTPASETAKGAGAEVASASTLADLLGIKPPQPPPPPFETAIYRRGHVQINKFVDGKLLASHTRELGPRTSDKSEPSFPADSAAPATPQKEE